MALERGVHLVSAGRNIADLSISLFSLWVCGFVCPSVCLLAVLFGV